MQISNKERGSIIKEIVQETIRKEGIGGMYRGFAIHVFGGVPAAAIYFGSFEFFKSRVLDKDFF